MNTAHIPSGNGIYKYTTLSVDNSVIEPLDSIVIYEHVCEKKDCKRMLTLNLVGTTTAHQKGWELVQKRDLMTIGISLGNGYFSRDRIEMILMGMANYFSELVVVILDVPALHSYRALGYDEHHAIKKIREHKNRIVNYCKSVFSEIAKTGRKVELKMVTWSDDFAQQEYYAQAYERAIKIYNTDAKFRESVQRNTEHYILARLEGQDIQQLGGMNCVVEKAAHYLIEEMALHDIFEVVLGNEPISSYYKELELIPNYVNGKYDNTPNKHVGWVVYNIVDSE